MTAAPVQDNAPDRRTTAGKAADLEARRAEALGRRETAVEKQHAKGKKTAMERIVAWSRSPALYCLSALTR